jgi:aldose 1-epimerase
VNAFEIEGAEMVSQTTLRLAAGQLRLCLSPSIGGSISAFEWIEDGSARSILRKCNSPLENVLDAPNFPLVPFVNRIRGGEFTFRGRKIRLAANMPGDRSPLHGQGWLHPWQVDDSNASSALLSYHHQAGEWPWDYEAEQAFTLNEGGFFVRLTCRNTSNEVMPCGLGQHPYFPCGPETRIATQVTHAWTIDEHVLPVQKVLATGRYDLQDRLACGQDLDHGFGGWGGTARMTDPAWPYEIELSSPDARFFQLYSPRVGGSFVAEPVTHANAALNAPEEQWSELGMRVLQPGEIMSLDMRVDVIPKQTASG